jgi:ribonuclease E
MLTGTFEVERIGQHVPDERVKVQTVSEGAASAAATIAADAIEPGEPEQREEEMVRAPEAQPGSPGSSKRKRRRRRGRDRDRASPPPGADANRAITAEAITQQDSPEPPASASPGNPPGKELIANGDGTVRKRRRRRRGRRGSRDNSLATLPNAQNTPVTADGPDEPGVQVARPGEYEGVDQSAIPVIATPTVAPNAPSEPVWSLSSDVKHAMDVSAGRDEPLETKPAASSPTETAHSRVEAPKPSHPARDEPSGPPRKGWWQRPFRLRE